MHSALREAYGRPLFAFLREIGANKVPHSGRTLFEHLVGTAALLEQWGADEDVCKAALFHSIYGTEFIDATVLPFDQRPRVLAQIGERAERLAYLFCSCERSAIYGEANARGEPRALARVDGATAVPVTARELTDLVWLFWANELEQRSLHHPTDEADQSAALRVLERTRPLLPPHVCAHIERILVGQKQ